MLLSIMRRRVYVQKRPRYAHAHHQSCVDQDKACSLQLLVTPRSSQPFAVPNFRFCDPLMPSRLILSSEARCDALEIDSSDASPDVPTLSDEIAKVFSGHLALRLQLDLVLALLLQLLYAALKTFAKLIRGKLERTTYLTTDAAGVRVHVVKLG